MQGTGHRLTDRTGWWPRARAASLAVALVALVAACGGGDAKATPTAAPRTTTTATSGDAAYLGGANAALDALATAAASVGDVMAKADPASAAWRASLNAALDGIGKVNAQARALTAPPAYAEAQRALVEVTGDFDRAAQLIRGAVDPPNADALAEASTLVRDGVTKVAAVRTTLTAR